MNITKKFGILATAFAALAAFVPGTAQAAGDIRSIDAVATDSHTEDYGSANPVHVGQKIKFEIRLLNTNGASQKLHSVSSPWMLKCNMPSWEATAQMFPLQVGLWMGGHRAWATLESIKPLSAVYADNDVHSSFDDQIPFADRPFYTRMIFSYEVQPGDIAMPVKFCNPTGTGVIQEGQELSFNNTLYWSVVDYFTGNACSFTMGASPLDAPSGDNDTPPGWNVLSAQNYENLANWDLSQTGLSKIGFFVQTVDFDGDGDPWRTIPAGSSNPKEGAPVVAIPGNVAENTTVYVWTEDKDIVRVNNGKNEQTYTVKDPATGTTKDYLVYTLSIANDTSVTFKLRADAAATPGSSTKVYLASTPTNVWTTAGVLITNFTSRVVAVSEPELPGISLSIDPKSITCDNNHGAVKAQLTIEPSQTFTEEFSVDLAATYDTVGGEPVPAGVIGLSTDMDGATDFATSIHIAPGQERQTVYVFGLGFNDSLPKTIVFKPSISTSSTAAQAFYTGTMMPTTLTVKESKPVIAECPGSIEAVASADYLLTLKLEDSYANLKGAYTIKWIDDTSKGTEDSKYKELVSANPLVPNEDGEVTVTIKYSKEGEKTSRIKVIGPDGNASDYVEFKANVAGAQTATLLTNREAEDNYHVYGEGEKVQNVRIELKNWVNETGAALYAFLVPTNTYAEMSMDALLSKEKVFTTTAASRGIKIAAGDTLSTTTSFTILDNAEYEDPIEFAVEIRTKQAYDDPTGERVIFVSPEDSSANYIDVTNCPPKFKTLGIKGGALAVNNGTATGVALAAEQGVTKTFEWTASDVAADMPTLKTKWTITKPTGGIETFAAMAGNPADLAFQYKFALKGAYTVQAQMWDKDMDENDEESWTTIRFYVNVGEAPALGFSFPNGTVDGFHYGENAIDLSVDDYFRVGPLTPATDDITIMVKATSLGDGVFQLYGADADGWVTLTIPAGVTLDADGDGTYTRVDLASMDGTAASAKKGTGVKLEVKCVTNVLSPDGIPYSDYFKPVSVEAYVDNRPPTLVAESEPAIVGTNTSVRVSANQTITISWEVTDVAKDLETGLTLKWAGVPTDFAYTSGSETSAEGSAAFSFSGAGAHTVSLYVRDKDKGVSETYSWTFHIAPSRDAYLIPLGPDRNGQSSLSSIYAQADGLGAGYVYAEGSGSFTKAAGFWHYYSFTMAESQPTFFATGYGVGDVDNGLLSDYDNPIDPNGNNSNAGTLTSFFKYDDSKLSERGKKDSFFYAWVYNASDEGGAMTGTAYPSPALGKGVIAKKTFKLPNEAESNEDGGEAAYPKLTLEAVFAREFYAEDNMGDINADGVPDFFAKKYDLYTLMAANSGNSSGSGDQQAGGLTDGMDVKKNVAAYNGDEKGDGAVASGDGEAGSAGDFLPLCYDVPGSFSWAPGSAFKAVTEIRGFHEGLNEPGVSDISLSEAERVALTHAFEVAKAMGLDHGCTDAEDWMTKGYWSPETQRASVFGEEVNVKRCDPTLQDTDADDIPDGYEYYIWYMAKIGTLRADGMLEKMTGLRFNPETPGRGDVIPAEVVAQAFNPVEPRPAGTGKGRTAVAKLLDGTTFAYSPTDFDEDGIPDWMEVALGTNPASCDTDGDGISDYFEVIYGTDPCDPVDGDRTAHWSKSNPDRDFMALAKTEALYTVVGLSDGTYWAFGAEEVADFVEPSDTTMAASTTIGEVTYYFASLPKTYADGAATRLLFDTVGYREAEIGGVKYAVTPTNFPACTALEITDLTSAGGGTDPTDPDPGADPDPDPGAGDDDAGAVALAKWKTGAKALPTFVYGGQEFVPACTNIKDNAETELKCANGTVMTDYVKGTPLTLIHNQVYSEYGFDPRTAWTIDDFGYVGSRWHKSNSQNAGTEGATGLATNTVPYTSRDEYLLSDYMHHVQKVPLTTESYLHFGVTTCPYQMYAVTNAINEADNKIVYGADTDGDGIPDGWELYVGLDPNNADDAKLGSLDDDGLVPLDEYAGTDSCYAYTNLFDKADNLIYVEVSSITKNNPGTNKGWYNKFFPTDPYDADTDGDGLKDDAEGKSWEGSVPVGRTNRKVTFNFIYGDVDELVDNGSCCIRGGGLNPCTVDTDQDLLPDAWEYEFAGWIVKKEESGVGSYIEGGMDGTWSQDACTGMGTKVDDGNAEVSSATVIDPRAGVQRDYDFDHDGLQNYQEYLVQAVRHFRFDDSETPLMGRLPTGQFIGFLPMQTFDGTAFFETCRAAGFDGSSAWKFRELGYFARPPHEWDRLACNETGNKNVINYADWEGTGYRIMLRPQGLAFDSTPDEEKRVKASGYCCTDPRKWDTDNDGMDDYYELFHGLNPLFGGVTDPMTVQDETGNVTDVIGFKYGQIGACINAWTGWGGLAPVVPDYDAMKYPWMIGDANCDADGDGLRNYEEMLLVNMTSPMPTHTDPTPLWMTDTTIANMASFTAQYYGMDPYQEEPDILAYPWALRWRTNFGATNGQMLEKGMHYMFSFEENEGYDTDHDGIPDAGELTKKVDSPSDPLLYADPNRRQAMWFPGEKSAVVSSSGTQQRTLSTSYDLLRQFTVECWIKPELVGGAERIILERVCSYGPSTLNNSTSVLRANFRLGIDADGCVFGEVQGNTVDSESVRITCTQPVEADAWVHYALTYDGNLLALYKDDDETPVAKAANVGVIPANGIVAVLQEGDGKGVDVSGVMQGRYRTIPCALVIGAAAKTEKALDVVAAAKESGGGLGISLGGSTGVWADFGDFYKGYVDEVRVWDGARTAAQIVADYRKRYTTAEIKAMRDDVFQYWKAGGVRNNHTGGVVLPAELLQHYNFVTLPGAVNETDVALEPVDFSKSVLDNVRVDGNTLDLYCGWWNALKTHSTVYRNYNLVPWIPNAVAHLPLMDGSVVDSQYWSENFAGVTPVAAAFPNSANPYPYYNFGADRMYHYERLVMLSATNEVFAGFRDLYGFQLRSDFVGTSDLLPLGGAFAKRCADYWDNGGAMDAWSQTGRDSDGDGLPDWWEMLYVLDIDDASDWKAFVDYEGRRIPAWEAYQRDLAKGMLPSGGIEAQYASKADADGNGLLDWWEKIYGFAGESTSGDHDNDQLSNYAEYLIGQCFTKCNGTNRAAGSEGEFKALDPTDKYTYRQEGQQVPDYFLRVGSLYLGEMFTDHDFVEDWWEATNAVAYTSRFVYDPQNDADDDGWSTFAECRYGFWKTFFAADQVTQWVESNLQQSCRPEPTIAAKVSYHGAQNVEGRGLVIRVSPDNRHVSDAQFVVPGSELQLGAIAGTDLKGAPYTYAGGLQRQTDFIGAFREGAVIRGRLHPGSVLPGDSLAFEQAEMASENTYVWNYNWYTENGWSVFPWDRRTGTFEEYRQELMRYPHIQLEDVELTWNKFTRVMADTEFHYGSILWVDTSGSSSNSVTTAQRQIGRVNFRTGEYELDMNTIAACAGGASALRATIFRVTYATRISSYFPQTLYLSKPQSGYVREGRNIVTAFIDMNRDGQWTPGEPFGAAETSVGWWQTSVEIELTDTAPQMARYDLTKYMTTGGSGSGDNASAYTDRDAVGYPEANINVFASTFSNSIPATVLRVRVIRTQINRQDSPSYSSAVVLDRTFNASQRPLITEADLVAEGLFDLDWGTLAQAWNGGFSGLSSASYRVVVGDGPISGEVLNASLPVAFVNVFETGMRATTTAHTVGFGSPNGLVDAGAPTFTWRHDNGVKDYPAFQLRVWKADGTTLVYDSGIRRAPARNAQGVYSWTAPLYAGMMTPQGVVFSAQENYQWAVSMLDAKYTEFNTSEPKSTFRLNTTGETTLSDYGRIAVQVKYCGPATVATTAVQGLLHVEAFTTPDFSGMPAGAAYVADIATLASPSNLDVNATITGLAKDGTYYIRAWIDTNGNYARDNWESWGYANYVGTDVKAIYSPKDYRVDSTATVYIEDTDIDNDGFPDVYEWEQQGNLDDIGPIANAGTPGTMFAKVNPDLLSALSAYANLDAQSASSVLPVVRLMSAVAAPSRTQSAAVTLLSGGAVSQIETDASVTIVSFSVENGIVVTVDASANTGTSLLTVDTLPVEWKLLYKASLVEAEWTEIASDVVSVEANTTGTKIDTTAMDAAIKARQSAGSGFFKVVVGVKK
ncbi:MAG: hypothetical protein MJ240_04610 [Kiritimatiellae bacterium]|nr:hypothetical protein [Kiritimatiellia bacterium]